MGRITLGTRPRDEGGGTEDSEPAGARRMVDEAIIERLIEIRGIGRWTVEMLLIFTLDRPDVLRVTDLGIRRGFMVCRSTGELPEPADLLEQGGNLASLPQRRELVPVAGERALRACASTRVTGFEHGHTAWRNGKKYAMALAATASPPAIKNA